MAVIGLAVAAVVPGWPENASFRERLTKRCGPLGGGFLLGVAPIAWLNHVRFGSLNPVSYGPVPWTGIVVDSLRTMTAAHELKYSAPVLAFFVALAGGLYAVRKAQRKTLWMAGVVIAGAVLALLVPALRDRLARMGVVTYGLIVDLTLVDMSPYYVPAQGGFGWIFAHQIPRATLQCTPALVLAPLALVRERLRWRSTLLLLPSAGFYASLIMRADMPYFDAIGWPWVYIRYTLLAVPLLVVATVAVLEDLGLSWVDAGIGLATAVAMAVTFGMLGDEESSVARRVMIVVLPIALAAMALVAAAIAVWRRAKKPWPARALAALVVGAGFAIAICVDYQANVIGKRGCDDFADMVAHATPERFAVIGVLGQFEIVAGLSTVRDVQYADLLRVPGQDLSTMRPLIDYWRSEGRPIFMFSQHPPQGWPDMSYTPMQANDLYRMDFQGDTNAAR
jgi:hypothetical protein